MFNLEVKGREGVQFLSYPEPLKRDLLPLAPPGARIKPGSKLPVEALGKAPSTKTREGWCGFQRWVTHIASDADLEKWCGWGAQAGLNGRNYPGLDIDVLDEGLASLIEQFAISCLGDAPVRVGRAPKRLLVYRGSNISYMKLSIKQRGNANADIHLVELLGAGKQYVVEGIHPVTLSPYVWTNGDLWHCHDSLIEVSQAKFETFFEDLAVKLREEGYDVDTSVTGGTQRAFRDPDLAPSLPEVRRALEAMPNRGDTEYAYHDWVAVLAKVHGATGGSDEGFDLFDVWSSGYLGLQPGEEECSAYDYDAGRTRWESVKPNMGWRALAAQARKASGGAFQLPTVSADDEFEAVEDAATASALEDMFRRYVYVEGVDTIFDLDERAPVSYSTFDVRLSVLGDPSSNKNKATSQFKRDFDRVRVVKGITYRPGRGLFLQEANGVHVNSWRPLPSLPDLPHGDEDVRVWLDHVAYLVPDETDRLALLNWMAWVVQNQAEKPNWGVLLGGVQGTGKSLVIVPLKVALGSDNVSVVSPEMLTWQFTDWLYCKKLFIVEELASGRAHKATMQRLKMFLSDPPATLPINIKHGRAFEVPNLVAGWFTTNHRDALAMEPGERRFFCIWSDAVPQSPDYYDRLVRFYEAGGAERAALWLMARDLSGFTAKGRAPETEAFRDMVEINRSPLEDMVRSAIENASPPFRSDIVVLGEVMASFGAHDFGRLNRNEKTLAIALRTAGAVSLGRHHLKTPPPDVSPHLAVEATHATLFAVRDTAKYQAMNGEELRIAFWAERVRTATNMFEGV